MGRKNTLPSYQMFGTAGCDCSVASSTSNVTEVQNMDNIGIIMNWTGTSPVGTLAIQGSNDQSTWASLDFGSSISISGNSGTNSVNIYNFPYAYIRAVYTKVSGTGTLFVNLAAKQMGG